MHLLGDIGGTAGLLEPVPERVEHLAAVGDPQVPRPPAPPLREVTGQLAVPVAPPVDEPDVSVLYSVTAEGGVSASATASAKLAER